jgi:hypothetical protein
VEDVSYVIINGKVYNSCFHSELEEMKKTFNPYMFCTCIYVQGDQNVPFNQMITVQKPGKNILNSFNNLLQLRS